MDVCHECCVLSGRCLCDELITRPEESYRLWCVVVCDLDKTNLVNEKGQDSLGGHRAKREREKCAAYRHWISHIKTYWYVYSEAPLNRNVIRNYNSQKYYWIYIKDRGMNTTIRQGIKRFYPSKWPCRQLKKWVQVYLRHHYQCLKIVKKEDKFIMLIVYSFIQYFVWRQVQSLLQNDASI